VRHERGPERGPAGSVGGAAVTTLLFAFAGQRTDLVTALRQPRTRCWPGWKAHRHHSGVRRFQGPTTWPSCACCRPIGAVSWLRDPGQKTLRVLADIAGRFLLNGGRIGGRAVAGRVRAAGPVKSLSCHSPRRCCPVGGWRVSRGSHWACSFMSVPFRRRRRCGTPMVWFLFWSPCTGRRRLWGVRWSGPPLLDHLAVRDERPADAAAVRGGSSEWAGWANSPPSSRRRIADVARYADLASHQRRVSYSTLMARRPSLRRDLQSKEREANRRRIEKLALPRFC